MMYVVLAALALLALGRRSPTRATSSSSSSSRSSAVFRPTTADANKAANELGSYLRAQPSALVSSDANVAVLQARMGGLTADGMVGRRTRARARQLGVVLP